MGSQIATLNVNTMTVNSVCFSPNSPFLITGSSDRTVKCWNSSVGKAIRVIGPHTSASNSKLLIRPTCVCFNQRDGETFAVGFNTGEVKVYSIIDGSIKWELKTHNASVRKIKFGRHGLFGLYLVSAGEDGSLKVTKFDSNSNTSEINLNEGNGSPINALALSVNKILVTGSEDCVLSVYTNVLKRFNDNDDTNEDVEMTSLFGNFTFIYQIWFLFLGSELFNNLPQKLSD
jgi:WD40 repeat protein